MKNKLRKCVKKEENLKTKRRSTRC